LTSDDALKQAEDKLLFLEQAVGTLEKQASPPWVKMLLLISNTLMGSALVLLILQTRL